MDNGVMAEFRVVAVESSIERSSLCDRILKGLPDWFGIPEAIENYVREVSTMETWGAYCGSDPIGFISINEPNTSTAEIHVMGVLKEFHRRGVGCVLVKAAEKHLSKRGLRFLQVKTLSPSRECPEYEATRKFYLNLGFCPVEEFKTLWGEANPCLQMIKPLDLPGSLHHVEIYVSDLQKSIEFWSWLLCDKLGYSSFQKWDQGQSFILGQTYLVFVQAEERFLDIPYHRCRPGLNHLAFKAPSPEKIDELNQELIERGCKMLYPDRYPHAGGNYHAVFFEDPDRIKVEVAC